MADIRLEPETASRDRADHALRGAVVTERGARSVDLRGDGGIRDDSTSPDGLDQFIARDDLAGAVGEMGNEVEHPGLNPHRLTGTPQLAPAGVEFEFTEGDDPLSVRHASISPQSSTRIQENRTSSGSFPDLS